MPSQTATSVDPADPRPAAAIKLGYASRDLGIDYLDEGLAALSGEFGTRELVTIRSLVSDISELSLQQDSAEYKEIGSLWISVNVQLKEVKVPALRTCLDRSSLANGTCGKWYRLGATLAECAMMHGGLWEAPRCTIAGIDLLRPAAN